MSIRKKEILKTKTFKALEVFTTTAFCREAAGTLLSVKDKELAAIMLMC
jgi:hypothetical protein